ncbi:MAG: hypothetical protein MUE69_30450 [Myxococcota bacterium]|nr:hypothetical protein [Myxococcota bacterium]
MGWSFAITSWSPDELAAVKAFATAHGSRRDGPLDDAWWAAAKDPRSVGPGGAGANYATGEAAAQALEDLADHWLFLRGWKDAGHGPPSRVVVVPFGFWLDGQRPEAVAQLSMPDGGWVVITEPLRLLDHWPGHEDPTYETRAAAAYEHVRSANGFAAPETSEGWERLHLGMHRWIYDIARAAWDARVPWSICW